MKKIISFLLVFFLACANLSAQLISAELSEVAGGGNQKSYDYDFVATDITAVMQALAVTAGVDFVVNPDARDIKIDLRITKKTWQEALEIICKTYGLTWIISDNYIAIELLETWQANEMKAAEKATHSEAVAPLVRKNFQIRHAKAVDLQGVLANMTSARGRITVVDRNNAIIVYDTEQRISQMEKTIEELDVETLQILITAKLVVVDSKLARELGVDWSAKVGVGGQSAEVGGNISPRSVRDSRNQATIQSFPLGKIPAVEEAGQAITMSILDGHVGMGIYNSLGEASGEILASPQISTMDHTEASIFMGDKISIRVLDDNGQYANELIESGIKLTVTPHVTGDNRIMLDLFPQNNSYSYDSRGQPVISTQEAKTKVVVDDGETVIIAGLTKNEEQETESGVPFLKDIPLIGNLFKHYKKEITKKDLMIFVTPHIQRNYIAEIAGLENSVRAVPKNVVQNSPELQRVEENPSTAVVKEAASTEAVQASESPQAEAPTEENIPPPMPEVEDDHWE